MKNRDLQYLDKDQQKVVDQYIKEKDFDNQDNL